MTSLFLEGGVALVFNKVSARAGWGLRPVLRKDLPYKMPRSNHAKRFRVAPVVELQSNVQGLQLEVDRNDFRELLRGEGINQFFLLVQLLEDGQGSRSKAEYTHGYFRHVHTRLPWAGSRLAP